MWKRVLTLLARGLLTLAGFCLLCVASVAMSLLLQGLYR
jgi:hypothetical protein